MYKGHAYTSDRQFFNEFLPNYTAEIFIHIVDSANRKGVSVFRFDKTINESGTVHWSGPRSIYFQDSTSFPEAISRVREIIRNNSKEIITCMFPCNVGSFFVLHEMSDEDLVEMSLLWDTFR